MSLEKETEDDPYIANIYCRSCEEVRPANVAMKDWARLEVVVLSTGVGVACLRCDCKLAVFTADLLRNMVGHRQGCACGACPSRVKEAYALGALASTRSREETRH